MPNTRHIISGLILSLLLISMYGAPLSAAQSPHDDDGLSSPPVAWRQKSILLIYLNAVSLISPEITADYMLNTIEDRKDIVRDITRNMRFAASREAATLPAELMERFESYVLPEVFEYLKKKELRPTQEEIERYYREQMDTFPFVDFFEGARFLIERGAKMEEKAAHWKKALDKGDKTFREVAREYYASIGVIKDGYLPRVYRGRIRDELFEIFFNADPDAPYFGPVETKHGLMFGKLYRVYNAEGGVPPEAARMAESLIIKDKLHAYYQKTFSQSRKEHRIEMVFDDSVTSDTPPLDTVLFQFDNTAYTYREVLELLPHYSGDVRSMDFLRSMRDKAIERLLLLHIPETRQVHESGVYHYLKKAFLAQYKVHHFLSEKYKQIDITTTELRDFYTKHRNEFYKKPPHLKLMYAIIPQNPDNLQHPMQCHLAQKKAWKDANRIHDVLASASDPSILAEEQYPDVHGLKIRHIHKRTPLDELDRLIQMDMDSNRDVGAGYTSSILIDRYRYVIYRITDRREGGYVSFRDAREDVEHRLREQKKEEIRARFNLE